MQEDDLRRKLPRYILTNNVETALEKEGQSTATGQLQVYTSEGLEADTYRDAGDTDDETRHSKSGNQVPDRRNS